MSNNDNTNESNVNNVVNINNCHTTPVVDAISAAHIYIDPPVWAKIITHESGKPHWLAILWFSKLLYWYQRTPVHNEETGIFIAFKKKFKYDKLQRSYAQIAAEMGCTSREAKSIIDALLRAKLITQELRNYSNLKLYNLMFIEPVPENILCIINPKGVHESTPPTSGRTRGGTSERTRGGTSKRNTYTLCSNTLSSPTLTSTYDSKGDQSVDNPGGLPTAQSPTNNKIDKEKRERVKKLLKEATEALTKNNRSKK